MPGSLFVAVLAAIAAAPADTARDVEADLRCMIGATAAADRVADDKVRQQLLGAAAFYMGRIDARMSERQIEARMVAMAPAMPSIDWQREMTACGEYLRQRGSSFQALGARLSKAAGH